MVGVFFATGEEKQVLVRHATIIHHRDTEGTEKTEGRICLAGDPADSVEILPHPPALAPLGPPAKRGAETPKHQGGGAIMSHARPLWPFTFMRH